MARKARAVCTPAKMIRAWVLAQTESYSEVARRLDCNDNTASRWAKLVDSDPDLLMQAKAKLNGKGAKKNPVLTKAKPNEGKLKEENAYLRWCLEGERQGFVMRMLEELGK